MNIRKMFDDNREFSRISAIIIFVIISGKTYSMFQEVNRGSLTLDAGGLDPLRLTIVGFLLVALALALLILGSFTQSFAKVSWRDPITRSLAIGGLILLVVGSSALLLAAMLSFV